VDRFIWKNVWWIFRKFIAKFQLKHHSLSLLIDRPSLGSLSKKLKIKNIYKKLTRRNRNKSRSSRENSLEQK